MKKELSLILLVMLVVAGCATQRYGRLMKVTDSEAKYLTCEQVDIEIEKTQEFMSETTSHKKKFTGKDVLSFLGDFGIGDNWEYNEAVKTAEDRLNQLMNLRREKSCN